MKGPAVEILDAAELGGERMSATMPSPIGAIEIIATSDALLEVRLTGEERTGSHDGRASAETFPPGSADRARSGGGLLDRAVRELAAYFRGELRQFTLPVALRGTPFQEEVWRGLLSISYGERRSYGWLAERIGRSGASRAVGAANGCNPIPIVVPCHRVIGADGSLTGYGGGLETKRWLLEHEAGQGELFSST